MSSPFRVDPAQIDSLGPSGAVDLAARLVRADAAASGISPASIDVPSNIYAPDGGIDGTAINSPRQSLHGLVKKGTTAYQFRSGPFAPARSIPDILLARGSDGDVRPRIRSCLEDGGTLVVMLFGWDGPQGDGARRDMAGRFLDVLSSRPGTWDGAKVDVWGRNRIVSALEEFPSLALDLSGMTDARLLSHLQWSHLGDMTPTFMRGAAEDVVVGEIRSALRAGTNHAHVRVTGEPGSGKTRLVLEALRAAGLSPRTVYAPDPAAATAAVGALRARAPTSTVRDRGADKSNAATPSPTGPILVVDDCDLANQASIWNEVMALEDGAHLVTIYNEKGVERSGITDVEVVGTENEQIAKIIREHTDELPDRDHPDKDAGIDEWAKYCHLSPRAAHIVGHNLVHNPDDLFRPPGNVLVWERWISSGGGSSYEDRYTALLWLSLFTKFGMDAPHERDMEEIAQLVAVRHPEMTWQRFKRATRSLRDIKVLQGHSIVYITPRLLHDYMWIKWWEEYGPDDVPRPLWPGGPGGKGGPGETPPPPVGLTPLRKRFSDMLERMQARKESSRIVERLFSKGGPFPDAGADADASGARAALASDLFAAAGAANPLAALSYAERAVSEMPADSRRCLADSATDASAAAAPLRRMLHSRRTFARAARLLLALAGASAECASVGRPSSGARAPVAELALRDAFDPAPQAGFSDTPLGERLEVLAAALRGGCRMAGGPRERPSDRGSEGDAACGARLVAVRACGAVLRMERHSPAIPNAIRFADAAAEYWAPEDRAGMEAYLRGVVGLLKGAARDPGAAEAVRQAAAQALLGGLVQAALLPGVSEGAIEAAEGLAAEGRIDGEDLLAVAERLEVHESHRIEPAVLARIRAIIGRGETGSLHERLVRRVGAGDKGARGRLGTYDNTVDELRRLASELAGKPKDMAAEVEWLAAGDVGGSAAVLLGRELASLAGGFGETGRMIADATRRARGGGRGGGRLLQGYVAELLKRNPDAAEDALDGMIGDDELRRLVPAVHMMAGAVSDRSAARLAAALRDGRLARPSLACLGYGRPFEEVGEGRFWDVLSLMVGGGSCGSRQETEGRDRAAVSHAAVNMLHAYYFQERGGPLPRARRMDAGAALSVLLDPDVLGTPAGIYASCVNIDRWFEVALWALGRDGGDTGNGGASGEHALAVAGAVIRSLGRPGLFKDENDARRAMPVLDRIARDHPREVWDIASACIDPAAGGGTDSMRAWLKGEANGMKGPAAADGNGGLMAIPMRMVIEWAALDGRRPDTVAHFLPPRLEVVREFAARFGHMDLVRGGLSFTFLRDLVARGAGEDGHTVRYTDEIARFEKARRAESDPNVAGWLDEHLDMLRARLADAEARRAQEVAAAAV